MSPDRGDARRPEGGGARSNRRDRGESAGRRRGRPAGPGGDRGGSANRGAGSGERRWRRRSANGSSPSAARQVPRRARPRGRPAAGHRLLADPRRAPGIPGSREPHRHRPAGGGKGHSGGRDDGRGDRGRDRPLGRIDPRLRRHAFRRALHAGAGRTGSGHAAGAPGRGGLGPPQRHGGGPLAAPRLHRHPGDDERGPRSGPVSERWHRDSAGLRRRGRAGIGPDTGGAAPPVPAGAGR